MTFDIRRQLDSDDLMLLHQVADRELERLDKLHWEIAALSSDPALFQAVAARAERVKLAKQRLTYLFLDQFPQGREENDRAGRTGIQIS